MNIATSLSERAMLVSLSTSSWQAKKQDKDAARSCDSAKGAASGTYEARKNLLPPGAEEYDAILSAMREAYTEHCAMTVPWSEGGVRMLLAAGFLEYTRRMEEKIRKVRDAVAAFVPHYPTLVEQAKARMNGAFNPNDYPSPESISTRFRVETRVWPMPNAADMRIDLADSVLTGVKAQVESQTRAAVAAGMADVWGRLSEALSRMVARLQDTEGRLYESVFSNLSELVEVLPCLNIAADPALEIIAEDIKRRLLGYSAKDVKQAPEVRKALAQDAARIAQDIAGFYSA